MPAAESVPWVRKLQPPWKSKLHRLIWFVRFCLVRFLYVFFWSRWSGMIFLAGGVGLFSFSFLTGAINLHGIFVHEGRCWTVNIDMMPLDLTFCDLVSNITHVYFILYFLFQFVLPHADLLISWTTLFLSEISNSFEMLSPAISSIAKQRASTWRDLLCGVNVILLILTSNNHSDPIIKWPQVII